MALKQTLDNLEGLSDELKTHYVERDGKFHLDGIEDTGALKRALEAERKERSDAKKALEKFKDIDPEKYAELQQDAATRELKSLERKGEYDKIQQQMADKHKAELSVAQQQIAAMRGSLESHLVDSEAVRAIASAKGVPELLLPHVRASMKVFEEGGKFVSKIVDSTGNPRIGDSAGNAMTVDQLVAEMRASPVFGRAFEGPAASGGGSTAAAGKGNTSKVMSRAQWNALDVVAQGAAIRSGIALTE